MMLAIVQKKECTTWRSLGLVHPFGFLKLAFAYICNMGHSMWCMARLCGRRTAVGQIWQRWRIVTIMHVCSGSKAQGEMVGVSEDD